MECKPSYEEVAKPLAADSRENLDMLMSYFGSLKLAPCWYATNAMNIKYKGKIILRFTVVGDAFHLYFTLASVSSLNDVLQALDDEARRFFFENLRVCTLCNPKHGHGKQMTILGHAVSVCAEPELKFINPTVDQVRQIIAFAAVRRANILGSR